MVVLPKRYIAVVGVVIGVIALVSFAAYFRPSEQTVAQLIEQARRDCITTNLPSQKRISCIQPYITELTVRTSAKEAINVVASLKDDGSLPECHIIAHEVGALNLKKEGSVGSALASCS